jgi:hypothetical protein
MTRCELHKTGWKSSRFLYGTRNTALFASKTVYRRLAKLQTKQLSQNVTPSAIIKVFNHYTKMFCFKKRGLLRFAESEDILSTADNLRLSKFLEIDFTFDGNS